MASMSHPPFSGAPHLVSTEAPVATGARTGERDSLFLMARLTLPGDRQPRDVRVRNLSEGGLMIESERPLVPGTGVMLSLRGIGEVTGEIAWYAEGRAGVAFDAPIDPMRARKPVGTGLRTPSFAKPILR